MENFINIDVYKLKNKVGQVMYTKLWQLDSGLNLDQAREGYLTSMTILCSSITSPFESKKSLLD